MSKTILKIYNRCNYYNADNILAETVKLYNNKRREHISNTPVTGVKLNNITSEHAKTICLVENGEAEFVSF